MAYPDYTVSSRDLALEVAPGLAPCYQDIHVLELNQTVRICFMPEIEGLRENKLLLSENPDKVSSPNEARLSMVWQWDYLVTSTPAPPDEAHSYIKWSYSNDRLSDKEIVTVFRVAFQEKRRRAFFFVPEKDFTLFIENLKQIEAHSRNGPAPLHASDLQELPVIEYVEKSVLRSLFIKQTHFAALHRPFENLMRLCVDLLIEHNEARRDPTLYHGAFNRNQPIENYVWGKLPYEYALLPHMHCIPGQSFLPAADADRTFWSIIQSVSGRNTHFPDHLIYGIYIWQNSRGAAQLHFECFKIWRTLDDWVFDPSPRLVEKADRTNFSELLTFQFSEIEPQQFARCILRYVTGQSETFEIHR